MGTIVFVHGTGVRLREHRDSFQNAQDCARQAGIVDSFTPCDWGDALGVEFEGKSLPDPPSPQQLQLEEMDFAQWNWLFDDPLFELDKLTIRGTPRTIKNPPIPGSMPAWQMLWEEIAAYQPSEELLLLLERGALKGVWRNAWTTIVRASPIPRQAFEASEHELVEASQALARSVIAQLHITATAGGLAGTSRVLRKKLYDRLLVDWNQNVFGLGTFFGNILKRAATRVLRSHRDGFSRHSALPIGDVLMYQSRGSAVRDFVRTKIEQATAPITLIGHSLGGVACVDLLALPKPPIVSRLITVGSQSPLLYELDAMASLKAPRTLPTGFPPWLNVYDRNDFLSYVAHRVFPGAIDYELESGLPFPNSHSAYFGNPEFWELAFNFQNHETCQIGQ